MAYRGHKRCDIDGQSDIASLILPPLGLTHTRTHIPLCCFHSSIALFLSFFLSSALTHEFRLCSLAHFSLLPLLSLTCSSLVTSSRGLVSSHFSAFWLSGGSTALSLAPFISSSAPPVLVCTHQPATQIPIIISQDQTTTTLCEGHRRKAAGEVKINTQHNQHKQSHQLQFTLRCCERHLEKFQTLKSEVLRDMKSALINILSSGNRLLLIMYDVVFSACLYPAGKKHKGTNVETSKKNYFTTSFHRHQDHKQKPMNNNSQCLSVWLHMITTVHVILASLYRRSCHRHFPSVTFINYCTLFPLSVCYIQSPSAASFFFPLGSFYWCTIFPTQPRKKKKKTLGIIF